MKFILLFPKLVGNQAFNSSCRGSKCRGQLSCSLEASICTLVKWLIQQEWAFLQYHAIASLLLWIKFIVNVRLPGTQSNLTWKQSLVREIGKWINDILPYRQRPEIISALQLIRNCIRTPVSQLRVDHLFSFIREQNTGKAMIKTDSGYLKACNPYGTLGEIQLVFNNALPVSGKTSASIVIF